MQDYFKSGLNRFKSDISGNNKIKIGAKNRCKTMLEQCLNEQYARTKFPYFALTELLNKFGEAGREELNQLKDEGKIRSRIYVNGRLVEIIV